MFKVFLAAALGMVLAAAWHRWVVMQWVGVVLALLGE
jgi:hypothetical protein